MINANLNYFDMAVLGVMFMSCLFAFFRGFVKEILSLIAWVGAAFITVRYFPMASEKLQPHFAKPFVAAIVATLSLYFGSLLVFAIFNRIVIKILKSGDEMGWIDNFLGLAFGGVRGAFIVSLAYLMIMVVIKDDSRPYWLEKAITRPYVEKGATLLANIAPKYVEELSNMEKKAKETTEGAAPVMTLSPDSTDMYKIGKEIDDREKKGSESFDQLLKKLGKR